MRSKLVRFIFITIFVLCGLLLLLMSVFPVAIAGDSEISSISVISDVFNGTEGDNMMVRLIESVFASATPYSEYKYFGGMIYFLFGIVASLSVALCGALGFISCIVAIKATGKDGSDQAILLKVASFFLMGSFGGLATLSYFGLLELTLGGVILVSIGAVLMLLYFVCVFLTENIIRAKLRLILSHRASRIAMLTVCMYYLKTLYDMMMELGAGVGDFVFMLVAFLTLPIVFANALCWSGNRIVERIHLTFLAFSYAWVNIAYIYYNGIEALFDSFVLISTALLMGIYIIYLLAFGTAGTAVILEAMDDYTLRDTYMCDHLSKKNDRMLTIPISPKKHYLREVKILLLSVGAVAGLCVASRYLSRGICKLFGWVSEGTFNGWTITLTIIAMIAVGIFTAAHHMDTEDDGEGLGDICKSSAITLIHLPFLPILAFLAIKHISVMEWDTDEAAYNWDWIKFAILLYGIIYVVVVLFTTFTNRCGFCGFTNTKNVLYRETQRSEERHFKEVPESRWTEYNTRTEDYGDTVIHEEIVHVTPKHIKDEGLFERTTVSGMEKCCVCMHITTFSYTNVKKISD